MGRRVEKGSMTVEAAIFLMFFIAGYLTILNFGRLTRAEVVVQHAINGSAMQISRFGYLLTCSGIADELVDTANQAYQTKKDIEEVGSAFIELTDAMGNMASEGVTMESVNDLIQKVENAEEGINIAKSYFQNPKGLLNGLIAIGKSGVKEKITTALVSKIAESQVEAYLKQITDDPDAYLEGLGIVGGLEGLDFRDSRCIANGTKDISITVSFKVKNQMFSFLDFGEHKMKLNASTRIW